MSHSFTNQIYFVDKSVAFSNIPFESLIYKGDNSYIKEDNSALEQERRASFEPTC